jgi:hypothetical protein
MEVFWQAGTPVLRPSAVRGLHSLIRSPFVDGLLPDKLERLSYGRLPSAVHGLHSLIRSPFVDGLLLLTGWNACPTAVCGLHSFIRSPFVDGLLPDKLESLSYGRLPSAVSIRLFVPHSLTVCTSSQAEKPLLRGIIQHILILRRLTHGHCFSLCRMVEGAGREAQQ